MATSSSPPTWLEKDRFSHFEVFSGNGSIQKSTDAKVMGFPPAKAATRPQRPGRCLLGPLSFWSGLVSFSFVKESRIHLRDFEHVPPFRSTHPLTEFTKAGFSFSRPSMTLLHVKHTAPPPQCFSLLHQEGPAQAGPTAGSAGSAIVLSAPRHYRIMPPSHLFLKRLFSLRYVLFLLYISCQFLFL